MRSASWLSRWPCISPRWSKDSSKRPSPKIIWQRFPKFVLGFLLASALASAGVISPELRAELKTVTTWAFALAFVSVGLEFSLTDLRSAGWRPVAVYGGVTVFNTVLALIVASVILAEWRARRKPIEGCLS